MNKAARFLIPVIVLIMLANIAHADSFDVEVSPVKDKILIDETAEFDVAITNNLETDEEFTIKKAGYPFWDTYTKPLQNPITLSVKAKRSETLRIYVDPQYITSVDTYTIELGVVLESLDEEQKVPLSIGIKSLGTPTNEGYTPTIVGKAYVNPQDVDPTEEFSIDVMLNNQNLLDYPDLIIKVESELFRQEIHTTLGPKEEKTINIQEKIDAETPPQNSRITVAIFRDGKLIVNPIIKEFSVKEYEKREESALVKSFLKSRRTITVKSNNPNYRPVIDIETTPFKKLFISTSPRAEVVKREGTYHLVWDVGLDYDKKVTVHVTENYRPIVAIAAMVLVFMVLYFILRSPIVLRKSIGDIMMSHGGISEAKMTLRLRNRSGMELNNIEVMDRIPHLISIEKELSVGSLRPHAILQHPKKGFLVKWNVEKIGPSDEIVLSYKVKSRLPILGELSLPSATARLKVKEREIITNSNRVSAGG